MEIDIKLLELFGLINKKIWKMVAPFLKELQMSVTDMLLLQRLAKKQSCKATELAALIGIPTSTLTGIADRLVAGGYIEREHDKEDRRSIIMRVTPKVRLIINDKKKVIGEILAEKFKSISESRKERLLEDLQCILTIMEEKEENTE
ncbi:MAG: MarR family transcriptional regulator [Spirochaetales bacterium]|nr:MarR family transcriptional regulator [Spirochaetales bacterium]